MADKAFGNIQARILSDINKGGLSGVMNYDLGSSDKWVYTERKINNASEPLLPTTQPYMSQKTNTGAETTVAATDEYRWVCIKNTGTTDGTTTTTEGIVISFDEDAAAFDEKEGIYIGPGDMWVSKFPSQTSQDDIYAITVAVTNDVPSGAAGTDGVLCIIAAVLED